MKREQYLSPDIKLAETADEVVPVLSFASPGKGITPERFDMPADGLSFTAYYDSSHRLIFVIDDSADDRTPNTLLVVNPDPADSSRKWDDILSSDYKVDLESIRPKKDNKYQKLDIEYEGLSVYNNLINTYRSGAPLGDALREISEFRNGAALRLAGIRLAAATGKMRTSADTLAAAEVSINTLHAQIKSQKEKLTKLRARVGKEPTKESAAKILRAQARIESAQEKLKRAELRSRRARRRLDDAEKAANAAREQLAALKSAARDYEFAIQQKVKEMPKEVKPLVDRDPNIMDEKIAFKPIEFNAAPQFVPPSSFPMQREPAPEVPAAPIPVAPAPIVRPDYAAPPPPMPPMPSAPMPAMRPAPMSEGSEIPLSQPDRQRPSAMYYVMLTLLIALSVMTLWLYQRKMDDNTPSITTEKAVAAAPAETPREQARPLPAPMPEQAAPKAAIQPIVVPEPKNADDNPFFDENGFMRVQTLPARVPEDMPLPVAAPEEPAPAVIQEPEYTVREAIAEAAAEPEEPDVLVVPAPKPVFDVTGPESAAAAPGPTCDGGALPDAYGCCAGEVLTDMGGKGMNCCRPGVVNPDYCFLPIR